MPRTIAIGDIHGCSGALAKLVERNDPQPDDVLVTLGDIVAPWASPSTSVEG